MEKQFYSIQEVAKILGFHYVSILRWVEDNKIPATKIGSRWRISANDLEKITQKATGQ